MKPYLFKESEYIIELYHEHKSVDEIAEMVNERFDRNRTSNGIRKMLTRAEIKRSRSFVNDNDQETAFSLYFEHGLRIDVIAEKLEIEEKIKSLKTLIRNEKKKRGLFQKRNQ